jgi:hypothetical protein
MPCSRAVRRYLFCLLAGGSVRAPADADHVLCGLLRVARLLGDDNNTTVLSGLHTDRLLIKISDTIPLYY